MGNIRPLFPPPDTRSLVERLRAWEGEPADYTAQLTQNAADEIERLRREVDRLGSLAKSCANDAIRYLEQSGRK